ncbi:MAG: sigma 54-interacting transcriptional regulator [Myxococcales bacterium]|nr:sigma 54-interacting transcriptional regulator [Myxococcales bacterium]
MATDLADGELLAGRYRFDRELGRGGSGRVVLARDTLEGGALRAIKLVEPAHAARLRWEFALLRQLSHPNLARVYELLSVERPVADFDVATGVQALVCEYAPGCHGLARASELAAEPEARLALALEAGFAAASALSAMHAAGLLHGDVKPENLVVDAARGRCTLVDLGLSGAIGRGRPAGTPGFMAPEVFGGERGIASDLYALGVTLWSLLRGAAPEQTAVSDVGQLLSAALRPLRERGELPGFVPAALAELIEQLTEADPARRLSSAREAAAQLAALAERRGLLPEALGAGADDRPGVEERARALSALPLVGREAESRALAEALSTPGLSVVWGPPGAGRSRLIRDVVWALQAGRAEGGGAVPTYRPLSALPRQALGANTVLHLEGADGIELAACDALLQAAQLEGVELALVLERERPLSGADASIELEPLAAAALRPLLEAALPGSGASAALLEAARVASGGLPGRLCRLLSRGVREGRSLERPAALRALGAELASDPALLGEAARELSELLSVAREVVSAAALDGLGGDRAGRGAAVRELLAAGQADERGGELGLRPDVRRRLLSAMPEARYLQLAARLPVALRGQVAQARLLQEEGRAEEALAGLGAALEALAADGQPEALEQLAREALTRLKTPEAAACFRRQLAEGLRAQGRYAEALTSLERVEGGAAGALRAELLRLCGRRQQAQAEARAVVDPEAWSQSSEPLPEGTGPEAERQEAQAAAQVVLARLAFDAGDLAAAERWAGAVLARAAAAPAALRAAEVLALAELYGGDAEAARKSCQDAFERARDRGERGAEARLLSVLAQVARAEGDLRGAARGFAQAVERAEAAGERHGTATFLHNLGVQRLDCGEPGPAIAALREAARQLAQLGRRSDLARVLYNLAYAEHLIGSGERALSALSRVVEIAGGEPPADAATLAYARCLEAESRLLRGERRKAARALSQLPELAQLPPADAATTAARSAVLSLRVGLGAEARETTLAEAERFAAAAGSEGARCELALARASLALEDGRHGEAEALAVAAHGLAQRVGSFDGRLRAALLSARCARAAGDHGAAARHLSEVRSVLDGVERGLDAPARARLRRVESYRQAFEARPVAGAEPTPASAAVDPRWQQLAGVAKRLSSEHRVGRLHELLLDAAIELVGAERGYLLRLDRDGRPRMRVGRGLDRHDLQADEHALSRSIVARVLGSGEALTTVDASSDERLSGAASVHSLALRSVVALPLRLLGEVRGALYLEDRMRPSAFGPTELLLLRDLVELGGLALASADALRAERRAARRLLVARARLARTVESQAIELQSLRQRGEADAGSVAGIVAESAAMGEVLALVRKVASSELPVLIRGESGTGKELIAQAVHRLGARSAGPFISENCGAIPETLLESALFGHVRGAFTGADRRRQGLFEVADGGTLFLDEIGEMSPSMQARLLRVLQNGEVRPVGGERAHKVDVRVIAATHRDLEAMVSDGSFREDLYYRLSVVPVMLPPLRERRPDIAPLIRHFLSLHSPDQPLRMAPRALSALTQHPWPGNVRQLENEMRRAVVLCDGLIDLEHLSSALLDAGVEPADPLDLKAQVDQLERRLIREALQASAGNQTRAARMLGVSRYGLQKMIKRLGLASLH